MSLDTPGSYEPAGMTERRDLKCRRCGAFALEKPSGSEFRFSCARYWRGPWSSHCWCCACPVTAFDVVEQQEMFA